MTLADAEAHQRRVKDAVDNRFHEKHRPRPNTALIAEAAKRKAKTKFRNVRCEAQDGTKFQSQLERDYYHQLLLRWKAGEVLWFVLQPSFRLEGDVKYRADFLVVRREYSGATAVDVIDCKGILTESTGNKLRQMKARYGINVQLVKKV